MRPLVSRFIVAVTLSVVVWEMAKGAPWRQPGISGLLVIPFFLPGYVVAGLLWGGMDNVGSRASQAVMILVNAIVYAVVLYLIHRVVSAFRRAKAVQ